MNELNTKQNKTPAPVQSHHHRPLLQLGLFWTERGILFRRGQYYMTYKKYFQTWP